MYRPSQTPRLAVSSNRIAREYRRRTRARPHERYRGAPAAPPRGVDARQTHAATRAHGGSAAYTPLLHAWLKNTVTAATQGSSAHAFRLIE